MMNNRKKSKIDDQSNTKKRNRSSTKKPTTEITSVMKKEEPIEQESPDVKPTIIPTPAPAASVFPPPAPPSAPAPPLSSDYICEWENCRKGFPTARAVFHHTCSVHVKYMMDFVCLWHGCDRIRRQKWALISHLQERHCSEAAFRQAKLKAANPNSSNSNVMPQPITTTITTTTTTSAPPTNAGTIGYAPDAAWLAVRRHMQVNSFDDLVNKGKEGPLTKSIRLTAALILRNIARHSSIGKQNLRQYEQLMANLALEASEASHTLSSCLFELYN